MTTSFRKGTRRSESTGRIEAACTSRRKGTGKTPQNSVDFIAGRGINNDAHAGTGHRQISILSLKDIKGFRGKRIRALPRGAFGENLILSGIDLEHVGLGSRLALGKNAQLSVTQIGKICHTRCAISRQTGDCIMPRLGVFARVLKSGSASPGDKVRILELIPRSALQAVVLTISDRCSAGRAKDTAGPAVCKRILKGLDAHIYAAETLPDEQKRIADRLRHYCDGHSIDLIVTVGGTGFSPRDVTPEAVSGIITRPTPGLDEAMRNASLKKTPHAMLSRGVSGISASTLIVSLPGSERGALENMDVILPALNHGLAKLRCDQSDCDPRRKGR
jgi:molybdenum cofactor synthesis domain-containing protein